MNKVILMGRLTKDPEVRYSQSANPVAVARYGLAVRKSRVKEGEPDVDFFNIVALGKAGEFAEKYFKKGQMVAVVGRLQVNTWEDQQKVKHTSYEVVVEEQHFAGSSNGTSPSNNTGTGTGADANAGANTGFQPTNFDEDDDLPF